MKRFVYWVICVYAPMFCLTANADINDGLDDMFITSGNEPTIYQSQRRLGVDLGSFRLRAPMSRVNVMNISPPGYRAGCGGLDLYGGSFTFINGEQFRQILRQIGANALGYAFKLALSTMCEKCDSILTGLQQKIDELNRMQMDSCRWAQGLVNSTADALPFQVSEKYKSEETVAGVFEDSFQGVISLFEDPGMELSGGDGTGADPNNKNVGNYTINALNAANISTKLTFAAGNLTHNELLMNIAGTYILRDANGSETEEGNVHPMLSARLSYEELKSGKSGSSDTNDAIPLMTCGGDNRCLDPTDLGEWDFKGVNSWVAEKLQMAADHMANIATASTDHPNDIRDFLVNLPLTVTKHMQVLQANETNLDVYVQHIQPYVTQYYSAALALNMSNTIRLAYDRPDSPTMPESVERALETFEADAKVDLHAAQTAYSETWIETETIMQALTQKVGEPISRVGGQGQ